MLVLELSLRDANMDTCGRIFVEAAALAKAAKKKQI